MRLDWNDDDGQADTFAPGDWEQDACTFDYPCGHLLCEWCWSGVWEGPRSENAAETPTAGNGDQLALPALKPLGTVSLPTLTAFRGCTHTLDAVQLPGGTTVYASDYYSRNDRRIVPDVAVYLDKAWTAEGFAFTLGWPDFGLPIASFTDVLRVARYVHQAAQDGAVCEIACLGSHGRTGTFLAILALLDMETPDGAGAVAYVRAHHCHKAVENTEQEWYVSAVAAVLNGVNIPAMGKVSKRRGRNVQSRKRTKKERGITPAVPDIAGAQAKLQSLKRGNKRG